MFEGLRKKLSEAVKGFVKKEEKELEERKVETIEAVPETVPTPQPTIQKVAPPQPKIEAPKRIKETIVETTKPVPVAKEEKKVAPPAPKVEQKPEKIVNLSFTTKLKSILTSTITLKEGEIEDFVDKINISLLESDVSYDTADAFSESLKANLKTAKIDAKNIQGALVGEVRKALFEILAKSGEGIQLYDLMGKRIAEHSLPVKILFLGPNGTGKTTTMAKIAYNLKKRGITSVLSASDTFRAAAIEQTEHHANKVGVPVIKSKYGADPASIAFDAVAYAKAHAIHTVLIDSAGRQETNKNLINEMQKMVRVAQPNLIVFVGESTAGNQLSEQIKEFNKFMKIDGIILTKLDCDAKGGNAISIAYTTGIPILFIGTGESYEALVQYTPQFIVDSILPAS